MSFSTGEKVSNTSFNDVTGNLLISKANTELYEKNYELIFGKKQTRKTDEKTNECVSSNKPEGEQV